MKNILTSIAITISLFIGAVPAAYSADDVVEIRLVDNIDEDRGYCLDVAGGKGEDAPIERGLQAHTCYDYTGGLLVDQSFDAALVADGQFKIPYFDVCMTVTGIEVGASIMLAACEDLATQQFSLEENGQLVTTENPELCITASATEKKEGRGATPVHVMRPVTLQPCSADDAAYQVWSTYSL